MSSASVSFHRLAVQEFRTARSWYARRSRRTALRFIEAIDRALNQIAESPERWPFYDDRHQWVKLRKFPHLLIYRQVAADLLVVVAVAHGSRRPGYWRRRRS